MNENFSFFFLIDASPPEIYPFPLPDALPIVEARPGYQKPTADSQDQSGAATQRKPAGPGQKMD